MADLLNRSLDITEQIENLKQTDILQNIFISSTTSELIEHDQQFVS